uniref:Uncharacterized protein n=1 Tax=Trichogramma kaykai TaxID=54128 RepID=A0ABD2X818_9HYME
MKPVVVYLACAWLLAAIATSQAGLPPPPSRQDDVLVLLDEPNVAGESHDYFPMLKQFSVGAVVTFQQLSMFPRTAP